MNSVIYKIINQMVVDIKSKVTEIENHIVDNQKDIFNLYNHYTHKWRGDRLNDINVGLFLNESNQPTVQIFVRNKTGYVRKHLIFNKEGNQIINTKTLNYKIMNKENNPKELEYWRKVMPSKTDEELEVYRTKWGKENPEYLKFKRLDK